MPIVKSLWIWVERHGLGDFQLCNPFTAAPCLTELELPGWLGEWVLKFPWSQLTKVKIPTTNFGDVIDNNNLETILSQLRNVEELRMDKMSIWRRNVPDWCSSPIRLPSLRFLSVPVYSPFTILRRLEAPLLEHLWVDWCPMFDREEGYHSVIFAEDLSYFIRHSSCRIRRLTLDDCESILSSDLTKLLSSIEKLCIKTATFQRGSFLVGHITQMNDGVCLPNLRELEVTCFQGRDDAEMLMTAMSGQLETRSEESRLISVRREDVPLEPTMARLSMSFK